MIGTRDTRAFDPEVGATDVDGGGFAIEATAEEASHDEGTVSPRDTHEHSFDTTGTAEDDYIPRERSGMVDTGTVVRHE